MRGKRFPNSAPILWWDECGEGAEGFEIDISRDGWKLPFQQNAASLLHGVWSCLYYENTNGIGIYTGRYAS